jgi:5-(carboxyamino)imidazole ribonucleotide synthase
MTTVGIVGAGQLARMLALAGLPLGLRFVMLDPAPDACGAVLGEHLCRNFDDPQALDLLASKCDVVTYEFENVPASAMARLAQQVPVYPNPQALAISRDRLTEKSLLRDLGIAVPAFQAVDSLEDLERAVTTLGLPAVLKTRTLGYDGKGQFVLRNRSDITIAWSQLGRVPLILERFVPFDREISMLGVRDRDGVTMFYPVAENVHREGILRVSRCRPDDAMQDRAQDYISRLLDRLDYVGVLALELFCVGTELMANEMAPRVHNSGHWTIEGTQASQFENHMRAVAGMPLGSTAPLGFAAMVNFIGDSPMAADVLAIPDTHLHLYGKSSREGRKVGHATIRSGSEAALESSIGQLLKLVQ